MISVIDRVVECIAVTTRYPKQLLLAEADLENDLGIDSVKRVEIVTALADEFDLDLLSKERDPSIRTIGHVAQWIQQELDTPLAASEAPVADPPQAPATTDRAPNGNSAPQLRPPVDDRQNLYSEAHPTPARPNISNFDTRGVAQNVAGSQGTLAGRVALITGSGHGVGRTIARLLAARGATVIVNSFHSRDLGEQTAAEINASQGQAIHLWGSVANPQQVDDIFDQVEQQFHHLDILVCNASDGRLGSFTDIAQADWDRAFRTNVTGHHQCAMRASQLMQRRGGGSIITMSSIAAHRYVEGLGGQGVVKAAVESMTRYLACELAEFGIRTNCVSGGPVYGEVMEQYPEARATLNYWESIVPDGELCSPLDLASTVAFLVSDEARAINGAVWTVDHGASTRAHSRPLPQLSEASIPTFT